MGKEGSRRDEAAQRALADLVRLIARQAPHAHCTGHPAEPSYNASAKKDNVSC
ncbi:hypothetical protein [Sphingobium sp. Cam5-1]|uniref:hypothetical protein n=1 Tax=Sphingobium sp. Cam5-1 TaxID=2789327 RepID=UPI001E4E9F39|nr:hypothetical protein [Sphingobium sp. Cam5-1]